MIYRILMIMLAFVSLASPMEAGLWDGINSFFKKSIKRETPSIKVLIAKDKGSMDVVVDGPFKGYDPHTGETILLSKLGKDAVLRVMDGGLQWSEQFPGVHQLLIVPTFPETKIKVDGVEYLGSMYFYDVENKLMVVNKLDIESYLKSTLSPLNNEANPDELLSAIAITARTNSYYQAENPANPYWSVDGSKVNYHGDINESMKLPVNKAIVDTKHMILSRTGTYEGMLTPFMSYWNSPQVKDSIKHIGIGSRISLKDAQRLAESNKNAAQLLHEAFPNASIELILQPKSKK
ncbi:MAG: SpoIID/LytB domain-containing protein [Chlamydiota bacterium]|nr:SpoIID/LytB domain-containing protein [Chlamydiota bacterium]